ncbi:MAG TPA: PHP domain-containing protein, partial [Flavobacteriaceae bacterium]|nr:PHP domain-containing protein [Flavobacteriaceae bacterium]
MYLIFDTETTGLPKRWDAPVTDTDNWPRCIQIAWQLHDEMGNLIEHQDFLVKPEGFNIPFDAEQIHGISTDLAIKKGESLEMVLNQFNAALDKTKFVVGQNVDFDLKVMGAEFLRAGITGNLLELPVLDTCTEVTAQLCQLPGGRGGRFKLPTLTELHQELFDEAFDEAHNATADVEATTRCFLELVRRRMFTREELDVGEDYFENFNDANPDLIEKVGLQHVNLKKASAKIREALEAEESDISETEVQENIEILKDTKFVHLHNHTQFSILQSTIDMDDLIKHSVENDMPAVAMTDHANMMGAFKFVDAVGKYNAALKKKNGDESQSQELKAIVGCEFNVCENHLDKSRKDNGYQIVLLAKNKNGYQNLIKLSSIAYVDGFYYVPRIDKKLIEKYKEDIIVLTGNLYGEVPGKILN